MERHLKATKRRKRSAEEDENEEINAVEFDFFPIYNELSPNVWERLNEITDFGSFPSSGELWPGGRVPYVFAEEFDLLPLEKLLIKWTMRNIESKSCVKFVPRSSERDYVNIIYDSYKCYSSVGRAGGEQPLSLGMFCSLFWDRGNIYHELLHALGFYHEHTRPDRDDHVEVKWDNIKAGMEVNFRKDNRWTPEMLQMPYDVESVMHYSSQAFSKMYLLFPTIVSRVGGLTLTRPRRPSELDYAKLNRLYGCPKYSNRRAWLNSRRLRRKGRELKRKSRTDHPSVSVDLTPPPLPPLREAVVQNHNMFTIHETFFKPMNSQRTYVPSKFSVDRIDLRTKPWEHSIPYESFEYSADHPATVSKEPSARHLASPFSSNSYFEPYAFRDMNSNVNSRISSQNYYFPFENNPSDQMILSNEQTQFWPSNYINMEQNDGKQTNKYQTHPRHSDSYLSFHQLHSTG